MQAAYKIEIASLCRIWILMLHQIDAAATAAAPTFDDVREAARTLAGLAVRTPLLESPPHNDRVRGSVLPKAEMLPRPASFKFRGAHNPTCWIPERDSPAGVVPYSHPTQPLPYAAPYT